MNIPNTMIRNANSRFGSKCSDAAVPAGGAPLEPAEAVSVADIGACPTQRDAARR